MWEGDLSTTPTPPTQTYLRVHHYDTRRTLPTPLADPSQPAPAVFAWNTSPDIRVRRAPGGAAPAAPGSLPWAGAAANPQELWTFQTALHSVDPLCRPTATWTAGFAARLRAFRAAQGLGAGDTIDVATWNAVMAAGTPFANPWNGAEPTEADLYELIHEQVGPSGGEQYTFASVAAHRVDVLLHHRHSRPVDAGDVNILLLQRPLAGGEAAGAALALSDAWKTAVEGWLGGATPALPDGWQPAEATALRHPAGAVDARLARAVTFELDLSSAAANSRLLLLAVVSSIVDPVTAASLTGGTVQDLVLQSRHVAARTLWIFP